MGEKNSFGLGRYVPKDVRREVRQRCGFGCVRCGLAYYDYEHFDPEFKDARQHDPSGITLLCMQCNQKRARGTLSVETVRKANEYPACRKKGFASELFDFGSDPLEVNFGGVTFYNCEQMVHVRGVDVLTVRPPEEEGSPVLLCCLLPDSTGAYTLKVEDNVWSVGSDNWDVEVQGPLITIRRGPGDIALQIRVMPPSGILIERINLEVEGYKLQGDANGFRFSPDGVNWSSLGTSKISHSRYGVKLM